MTTSLLNKTIHTKPKPTIPSNPLKHNNFLTQQNSLEKSKLSLSHEHTNNSNNNPLPLSSPINALLPPVLQTKENTTCEILIADFEFRPKQARVKINSKVQWTIGENKTSHQSGIYSTENRNFVIGIPDFDEESDLLSRGQTYEFSFNKTGNFDVICSNYPRMQGKVEVYGDEDEIMFKKVQHEMKARGLLLSGKQFDEKFFGHNNHKPILLSPPPKKIQDKYPSPYKNLEEAHSEEDSNVQELLQELNAKGPSIKSNKSKSKGSKRREFEFDDERKTEELFKQLRSRSEASDDDDDIRNFSLDTSDAYRMSDNEEDKDDDKDEELQTKYNQILMSPSRFTIHEIMKMGAKLENSMIKKEKLEEEEKNKSAQQKESEAPINQGDILIEIQQELENNDHEEEKLKDVLTPSSEKEVAVVNLNGEKEKENLNEKPKKKNKNKKKKKKKAAGAKTADPSAENTPTASQDTVNKEAVHVKVREVTTNEIERTETNNKVSPQIVIEPKTENNKQSEKSKGSIAKEKIEKENKNGPVVTENPEPISKPLIEEQKFQTVVPSSTAKETKNQNTKEVETEKKKTDNNKKGSTTNEKKSKINEQAKTSVPVQQQTSFSKANEQQAPEEAKSQQNQTLSTPKINEKPKEQNQIENQKNVENNDNKETNNKKKKKRNNKKRKELNRQNSVPSEPKAEVESLDKLETVETTETPQDLTTASPISVLKEAIPLTAETSEATSSEEKEPALLGNEAFLAFLKDAVKPEASKYQKSFRSNKNKNKKSQKEVDYSEEDDRIAALSAFLSNRYDYAEAFN